MKFKIIDLLDRYIGSVKPFIKRNDGKILKIGIEFEDGSKEFIIGRYKHVKNNNLVKPTFIFLKEVLDKNMEIRKDIRNMMINSSSIISHDILEDMDDRSTF